MSFLMGWLVGAAMMYGLGWLLYWDLGRPRWTEAARRKAQCRAEIIIKYRAIRDGLYPWWPNYFWVVKSTVGWLLPLWFRRIVLGQF